MDGLSSTQSRPILLVNDHVDCWLTHLRNPNQSNPPSISTNDTSAMATNIESAQRATRIVRDLSSCSLTKCGSLSKSNANLPHAQQRCPDKAMYLPHVYLVSFFIYPLGSSARTRCYTSARGAQGNTCILYTAPVVLVFPADYRPGIYFLLPESLSDSAEACPETFNHLSLDEPILRNVFTSRITSSDKYTGTSVLLPTLVLYHVHYPACFTSFRLPLHISPFGR